MLTCLTARIAFASCLLLFLLLFGLNPLPNCQNFQSMQLLKDLSETYERIASDNRAQSLEDDDDLSDFDQMVEKLQSSKVFSFGLFVC